jgi:hypothetical protein
MRAVLPPFAVALLLAACPEAAPAALTVVVEGDRSRILSERARVDEIKSTLRGDRDELQQARADLEAAREKLLRTAARGSPEEKAAAAAEEEKLLAREQELLKRERQAQADAPLTPGLSKAEVDALLEARLRESEDRVAARVATLLAAERKTERRGAASGAQNVAKAPEAAVVAAEPVDVLAGRQAIQSRYDALYARAQTLDEATRLACRADFSRAMRAFADGDLGGADRALDDVEKKLTKR